MRNNSRDQWSASMIAYIVHPGAVNYTTVQLTLPYVAIAKKKKQNKKQDVQTNISILIIAFHRTNRLAATSWISWRAVRSSRGASL
jgi:hypothetical protein